MESLGGINKVWLLDSIINDFPNYENIDLGISLDGKVYFESTDTKDIYSNLLTSEPNPKREGSTVTFRKYSGKLFVPATAGIAIVQSVINLKGITASPMQIVGNGEINLIIDKKSGLELCLDCNGVIRINDELRSLPSDSPNGYMVGREYRELREDYIEYLSRKIVLPKINTDKSAGFKTADFSKSILTDDSLDVCAYHKVVSMIIASGVCNIFYIPPFETTPEGFKLHIKKNLYEQLEKDLKEGKENPNSNNIKNIAHDMKYVKGSITRLKKKIELNKNNLNNPAANNSAAGENKETSRE